jgi:hypothetical protein
MCALQIGFLIFIQASTHVHESPKTLMARVPFFISLALRGAASYLYDVQENEKLSAEVGS